MSDDDAERLAELRRDAAGVDLDATTAERIAHRARLDLGRPLPKRRWLEPLAVIVLTTSLFVWALLKVLEAYR